MRILIIKLGALGDVLRTTALLGALKKKHPQAEIWWACSPRARPLLEGLPITRVLALPGGETALAAASFDWVLCLEESREAAGLESRLRHGRWTGVVLRRGRLAYTRDSAAYYDMSLLNRGPGGSLRAANTLKRANALSYEALWSKALGLPGACRGPILRLSARETSRARAFLRRLGLARARPLIAIHPGSGARWPSKRIPEETVLALARTVQERWDVPLLLLGGPEEAAGNARLAALAEGRLVRAGALPLRLFAAVVGLCDALLCADSLALHVGNAAGVPVVAAFGPTSSREVRLRRGRVLSAEEDCRCYYRAECRLARSCLSDIPLKRWKQALTTALKGAKRSGPQP